eukprot:4909769-Amphidinium_carterae.1
MKLCSPTGKVGTAYQVRLALAVLLLANSGADALSAVRRSGYHVPFIPAVWPAENTTALPLLSQPAVDPCEFPLVTSEDREAESAVLDMLFKIALLGCIVYLVQLTLQKDARQANRWAGLVMVALPLLLLELWVIFLAISFFSHPTRPSAPDCGYFGRCQHFGGVGLLASGTVASLLFVGLRLAGSLHDFDGHIWWA